jgi:hypothetical protein
MKPWLSPSGLQQGIALIIQQNWSPEQAVAVVQLLGDLQEVIYRHYQPQIQQFMRQDRGTGPSAHSGIHDDDVPF